MDQNNIAMALRESVEENQVLFQSREVFDLQLALIGGGTGEVTPY